MSIAAAVDKTSTIQNQLVEIQLQIQSILGDLSDDGHLEYNQLTIVRQFSQIQGTLDTLKYLATK